MHPLKSELESDGGDVTLPTNRNRILNSKWITALSVLAVIHCSATAQAQVSTQFPFCLQGDDYPGWSNCSFASYQQCQAPASGTVNECLANPWYQAGDNAAPAPDANTASPSFSPLPVGPPPN
jgi:hypothetical protein